MPATIEYKVKNPITSNSAKTQKARQKYFLHVVKVHSKTPSHSPESMIEHPKTESYDEKHSPEYRHSGGKNGIKQIKWPLLIYKFYKCVRRVFVVGHMYVRTCNNKDDHLWQSGRSIPLLASTGRGPNTVDSPAAVTCSV